VKSPEYKKLYGPWLAWLAVDGGLDAGLDEAVVGGVVVLLADLLLEPQAPASSPAAAMTAVPAIGVSRRRLLHVIRFPPPNQHMFMW
jgi:hypothetical protein